MLRKVLVLIGAGIVLVSLLVTLGFLSVLPWIVVGIFCSVAIGVFGWLINLASKEREAAVPSEKLVLGKKLSKKWIANREIVLEPSDYETFAVNLKENEHLSGEVVSDSPINVFLVNRYALAKFENDEDFSYEECGGENIKRTDIDFAPAKAGEWFLIVHNEANEETNVEIRLYSVA